jgi:hypothetical protein
VFRRRPDDDADDDEGRAGTPRADADDRSFVAPQATLALPTHSPSQSYTRARPITTTTTKNKQATTSSRAARSAPLRRARTAAPLVRPCRAAPQEEPKMEESGYVNSDSAGQSNMYPVITRAYEAKATDIGLGNVAAILGAAAAAGAAIFLGLNGVTAEGGLPAAKEVAELAQYATLGEYAAKFESQL